MPQSPQRRRYFLPIWSCSVWGLPCPLHHCRGGALLPHLFTLTPASPPGRYIFCGTFRPPGLNLASRTLSGTLLCGVRTFLSPRPKTRKATARSGCLQASFYTMRPFGRRSWIRFLDRQSLPGTEQIPDDPSLPFCHPPRTDAGRLIRGRIRCRVPGLTAE